MHFWWLGWLLASQPDAALLERANAILAETPLIDGHNDLPSGILDAAQGASLASICGNARSSSPRT